MTLAVDRFVALNVTTMTDPGPSSPSTKTAHKALPSGRMGLFMLAVIGVALVGVVASINAQSPRQGAPLASSSTVSPPIPQSAAPVATGNVLETSVPLENDNGTFVVPVVINDTISLKFTIDSGATDVSIPQDVASTLVRSGTISAEDYIGNKTFTLADGSTIPSAEFRLKSLRVGTLVLNNITASLSSQNGQLLLGQSFLTRLESWSIDNGRHVLLLKAAPGDAQIAALSSALQSTVNGAAAEQQTSPDEVGSLLSEQDIGQIAAQFNAARSSGGMTQVDGVVANCYNSLTESGSRNDRERAAYCITLDLVGLHVDEAFRHEMKEKTSIDVPPDSAYVDTEWQSRLGKYLPYTTVDHSFPPAVVFQNYSGLAESKLANLLEAQSSANGTN